MPWQPEGGVCLLMRHAEVLSKLLQTSRTRHAQKEAEPTGDELAQALEMQSQEVEDLLRVYRPHLSLDVPITDENDPTGLELLTSRGLPSSEEVYAQAAMVKEVHELLAHLWLSFANTP